MAERGARHFIFLSRSGMSTERHRRFLRDLSDLGVSYEVVSGDVGCLRDVRRAVETRKYPIRGVIQGALVLKVRG